MAGKNTAVFGIFSSLAQAEHGKVTLRGPVHTEEESRNIAAKATEVAGVGNVVNQLSIKGDKTSRK